MDFDFICGLNLPYNFTKTLNESCFGVFKLTILLSLDRLSCGRFCELRSLMNVNCRVQPT